MKLIPFFMSSNNAFKSGLIYSKATKTVFSCFEGNKNTFSFETCLLSLSQHWKSVKTIIPEKNFKKTQPGWCDLKQNLTTLIKPLFTACEAIIVAHVKLTQRNFIWVWKKNQTKFEQMFEIQIILNSIKFHMFLPGEIQKSQFWWADGWWQTKLAVIHSKCILLLVLDGQYSARVPISIG